eukprot:m.164663 g.164663  ORF g.164663 m.164663 type:complete len:450 (-) comp31350_c0_seq1:142-1491(-)
MSSTTTTTVSALIPMLPCESIATDKNNQIVIAMSVFGCIALVMALSVLLVIFAHNKDKRSFRHRILVGLFSANVLLASVDVSAFFWASDNCNGLSATPFWSLSFYLALFMSSKYLVACYELFVVVASAITLRSGSININPKHEMIGHTCCAVVAAGMLIGMLIGSNDDDIKPQDPISQNESLALVNFRISFLMRLWLAIIFAVLLVWGYIRFSLVRLMRAWDKSLVEANDDWDRDLWNRGEPYVEAMRQNKRLLLDMQRESYLEVTKPLEWYIVIFVVFAPVPMVMATDFCVNYSASDVKTVSCFGVCLLVLTFRTVATVIVFFMDPQARSELFDVQTLFTKAWLRVRVKCQWCCSSNVGAIQSTPKLRFKQGDDLVSVREFHRFENNACAIESDTNTNTSDGRHLQDDEHGVVTSSSRADNDDDDGNNNDDSDCTSFNTPYELMLPES